ncbi:MAG: ABC transporter substrate-binding protein [Oscillospiraceae bacterium]|nr:ABC transporter substrate-binding protein [Oscillospiraceae bacterium]
MKLKQIASMALVIASLLFLPACQSAEIPQESGYQPITVLGVSFTEPPERVASLSPSTTEMILQFGLEDRLIARTDGCMLPDGIEVPSIGDGSDPDFDRILASRPSLVISQNSFSKTTLDKLNQAGVKALVIPPADDLRELQSYYIALATVFFGSEEGASKAKNAMRPLVLASNAIRIALADSETISFVYFLKPGASAATADTFIGNFFSCLGKNAAQGSGYQIDFAQAQETDPSYLFLSRPYALENLMADPGWAGFSAVQNGNVLSFDASLFERRNLLSLADVLLETAKTIYPERAEEIEAVLIRLEAEAVLSEIAG